MLSIILHLPNDKVLPHLPPEPPSLKKLTTQTLNISPAQPSNMQIHDFPSHTLNNPDSRPSQTCQKPP
ncbi:hypothetical protein V8C44DRAFT_343779 [Trichoderma aethiopicum]